MMITAPKYNSKTQSLRNFSLRTKPLILEEILQLRDGLELPRKTLPGFATPKTYLKFHFDNWITIGLN